MKKEEKKMSVTLEQIKNMKLDVSRKMIEDYLDRYDDVVTIHGKDLVKPILTQLSK